MKDVVDTSKKNIRRKRMAEVLVPDLVPSSLIQKIHLYSRKWYDYFMETKSNPEITTKELPSISFTQKSALFDQKTDVLLGKGWVKAHSGSIWRVKSSHPVKEIATNVKVIKGNLFSTKINTIVNSINCVGVMGAGIAFEFRLRYPQMFKEYKEMCDKEEITVGKLWIYNAPDGRKIINFPSKHHWKLPSKYEYLESGLQNFLEIYEKEDIDSVAFPVLGANKGSLPEKSVLKLMLNYLSNCDIPVEIYTYDEFSGDDIFDKFKEKLTSMSTSEICKATNLRKNYVAKVKEALEDENIRNMRGLGDVKGIGVKTIEKCFKFTRHNQDNSPKWFTDN